MGKNLEDVSEQDLLLQGWTKVQCIVAKQPGGTLYTFVIGGKTLAEKAAVLAKDHDDTDGVQRIVNKSRLRRIAKYLATQNALLPTNIIVNIGSDEFVYRDGYAYLRPGVVAEILDGQHRAFAFNPPYNEDGVDFDLVVTTFVDADIATRARTFYKINREQVKVDPTLAYRLLKVMGEAGPDELAAEWAEEFATDPESPFYGKVRMTDAPNPNASISMAGLTREIRKYLKRTFAKDVCAKDESERAMNALKMYFAAIEKTLPEAWQDPDHMIGENVGVTASLEIFRDVLTECQRRRRDASAALPTLDEYAVVLEPLRDMDWDAATGLTGGSGATRLASMMREQLGLVSLI